MMRNNSASKHFLYTPSKHAPQLLNKQGLERLIFGGGVSPRNIFLSILTCATRARVSCIRYKLVKYNTHVCTITLA